MKKLYNNLDNNKDEIKYLRNKVDQQCDIIIDMEHELEQIDQKYKEAKNEIEYQTNVKANNERMISNVNEMRQESEEKCFKFEHEMNVSKKKSQDKLEQKSNLVDEQEDVKKLLDDIENLKLMNVGQELEIEHMNINI